MAGAGTSVTRTGREVCIHLCRSKHSTARHATAQHATAKALLSAHPRPKPTPHLRHSVVSSSVLLPGRKGWSGRALQ